MNREMGLSPHSLSYSCPVPISHTLSVDVKHHERMLMMPELRDCVKGEVAVLGSRSVILIVLVSVDVKQH